MKFNLYCTDLDAVVWNNQNRFTPLNGTTHVWLIKTKLSTGQLYLPDVMSEEEKLRMNKFRKEDDRLRFLFAHTYKRILISKYLNKNPEQLEFSTVENNKPVLVNENLKFNFSHSADNILFAFNQNTNVGCDTEAIRANFNYHDFMQRYYSKNEIKAISEAGHDDLKRCLFFKFWSRKEAWLKTTGLGVFDDLRTVDTAFEQNLLHISHDLPVSDCRHFYCVSFQEEQSFCSVTLNNKQSDMMFFKIV